MADPKTPTKKTPPGDGKKKGEGPGGIAWPIWAGAAAVGLFLFFRSRSAAPAASSLVGAQAGGLTPVVGEPPSVAVQPNTLQSWSTAAQTCAVGQGISAVLIEQAIADMIAGATMSQEEKHALNTAFGCAGPPPANFQLGFTPPVGPTPKSGGPAAWSDKGSPAVGYLEQLEKLPTTTRGQRTEINNIEDILHWNTWLKSQGYAYYVGNGNFYDPATGKTVKAPAGEAQGVPASD